MQLYANNPTHRSTIHNNNKAFSRSSWCTPIHKLRRQTEGLAEAEVSKHKESTSSKSTSPATSVWERSPDIPPSSSRVSEAPSKCPPPRGEVLNAPLQVMTSWTATSAVPSANPSVCRRNSWKGVHHEEVHHEEREKALLLLLWIDVCGSRTAAP